MALKSLTYGYFVKGRVISINNQPHLLRLTEVELRDIVRGIDESMPTVVNVLQNHA